MANKYAPRTSSVKQPQKNDNGYGLLWTFLIVFAAMVVLGSLLREKVDVMNFGRGTFLLNIFYGRAADIFSRALGMPIAGGFGRLITLAAAVFYLFLGVKMYNVDCDEGLSDFADPPQSMLSRGIHFVCAYAYLARLSYLVLDGEFFRMVYNAEGTSRTALGMFAVYLFIALHDMADPEDSDKRKYVYRFFSSFAIMLGVTGLARVLWDYNLAKTVILPAGFNRMFANIAAKAVPTFASTALWVLILLAVVCAVIAFGYLLGKHAYAITFSIVGSVLLIYCGYTHYARFGEAGVEIRALSHWILSFVMIFTWLKAENGKKVPILLGATGLYCSLSTLVYAFRNFYEPYNNVVAALDVKIIPKQEQALAFITRFIKEDVAASMVAFLIIAALLIASYMLLGKLGRDKGNGVRSFIPPKVFTTASMLTLGGLVLRFMHAQEKAQFFVKPVGYVASMVGIILLLGTLVFALALRNPRTIAQCIYMLLTTSMFAYIFVLFAFQFGMIVIALLLCANFIGMAKALKHAAPSLKDLNKKELMQNFDAIDVAYESGAINSYEAFRAYSAALSIYDTTNSMIDGD